MSKRTRERDTNAKSTTVARSETVQLLGEAGDILVDVHIGEALTDVHVGGPAASDIAAIVRSVVEIRGNPKFRVQRGAGGFDVVFEDSPRRVTRALINAVRAELARTLPGAATVDGR